MAAGRQSARERQGGTAADDRPAVSVHESAPGTAVFIEAENTDGWIASDTTRDVTR